MCSLQIQQCRALPLERSAGVAVASPAMWAGRTRSSEALNHRRRRNRRFFVNLVRSALVPSRVCMMRWWHADRRGRPSEYSRCLRTHHTPVVAGCVRIVRVAQKIADGRIFRRLLRRCAAERISLSVRCVFKAGGLSHRRRRTERRGGPGHDGSPMFRKAQRANRPSGLASWSSRRRLHCSASSSGLASWFGTWWRCRLGKFVLRTTPLGTGPGDPRSDPVCARCWKFSDT